MALMDKVQEEQWGFKWDVDSVCHKDPGHLLAMGSTTPGPSSKPSMLPTLGVEPTGSYFRVWGLNACGESPLTSSVTWGKYQN